MVAKPHLYPRYTAKQSTHPVSDSDGYTLLVKFVHVRSGLLSLVAYVASVSISNVREAESASVMCLSKPKDGMDQ